MLGSDEGHSLHVQYLVAAVDRDKIPENKGGKGGECFIHLFLV